MARGLKSSATVPVVIDLRPPTLERSHLIFENRFEFFDFSVMGEESRLHVGEPSALHIVSDAIA
jgi:hypothetical protein